MGLYSKIWRFGPKTQLQQGLQMDLHFACPSKFPLQASISGGPLPPPNCGSTIFISFAFFPPLFSPLCLSLAAAATHLATVPAILHALVSCLVTHGRRDMHAPTRGTVWTSGKLRAGLLRGQRASSARPPGTTRGGLLESSPGRSEHERLWRRRAQAAPAARSTSGTGAGAARSQPPYPCSGSSRSSSCPLCLSRGIPGLRPPRPTIVAAEHAPPGVERQQHSHGQPQQVLVRPDPATAANPGAHREALLLVPRR
jgi:hypothetical protein